MHAGSCSALAKLAAAAMEAGHAPRLSLFGAAFAQIKSVLSPECLGKNWRDTWQLLALSNAAASDAGRARLSLSGPGLLQM
jgi:hypothetical protein